MPSMTPQADQIDDPVDRGGHEPHTPRREAGLGRPTIGFRIVSERVGPLEDAD